MVTVNKDIYLNHELKLKLRNHVVERHEVPKQSPETIQIPSLAKRAKGRFSDKKPPSTEFDDLTREPFPEKGRDKIVRG